MTITTTQYQTVQNAVNTLLEGADMELVFNNTPMFYSDFIHAFNLDTNSDTFEDDFSYSLLTLENVANNIINQYDMNVFSELSDYYSFDETLELIENESLVLYHDVFEMSEVAENYLIDTDGIEYHAENYIDEAYLLRDLYLGGDITEYYYQYALECAIDEGKEENEAKEIAENYEITKDDEENYLGLVIECAGKEFLSRYFDFEKFGRDMEIEGNYITTDSGIIEVIA